MPRCRIAAPLLLVLAACGGEGEDARVGDDAEIVAKVLANTATVHADRLEFPRSSLSADLRARIDRYADAIQAGKSNEDVENVLLVSDRADAASTSEGEVKEDVGNPYGFIRRAVSYRDEGDVTVVPTELATLAEVFQELEQNGLVEVGPPPSEEGAPQAGPQATKKFTAPTIPIIDLSGTEIFRQGDTFVRLESAWVHLDTAFDVGLDIGWFKVQEAHVIVVPTLRSELVIEGGSAGSFQTSVDQVVFRQDYVLAMLGPVPLTLDVEVRVLCDLAMEGDFHARGGAHADLTLTGGFAYDRSEGLRAVHEPPLFEPQIVEPELLVDGTAQVRCALQPRVSLMLFDRSAASLTTTLAGQLDVTGPLPGLVVSAGVTVDLEAGLDVFGKKLGAVEEQLFDVEQELWSGP